MPEEFTFSFIIPTRGRQDSLYRLCTSIESNTRRSDELEIVLVMDSDDPASLKFEYPALNIRQVETAPGKSMGELNMAGYNAASGRYLMLLNDDVIISTKGWDEQVLEVFHAYPDGMVLVHVNDSIFREKLCIFPFLTREFCELAGGICPEGYVRYFIDNHIHNVFDLLTLLGPQRQIYLPDVVFQHLNLTMTEHGLDYIPNRDIHRIDLELFESLLPVRKRLALAAMEAIVGSTGDQNSQIWEAKLRPIPPSEEAVRDPRNARRHPPNEGQPPSVTVAVASEDLRSGLAESHSLELDGSSSVPSPRWPLQALGSEPGFLRTLKRLLQIVPYAGVMRPRGVNPPENLFDADYYLSTNPDVAAAGVNPLLHFIVAGAFEGRRPHPLFDPAYYLRKYPDVAVSGVNPLAHYLKHGAAEGRQPHPWFKPGPYLDCCPKVRDSGENPLLHFLRSAPSNWCRPHPQFDCQYYLSQNADVPALWMNPLVHFVLHGEKEGRRPNGDDSTLQAAEVAQFNCSPDMSFEFEDLGEGGYQMRTHSRSTQRAERGNWSPSPDGSLILHMEEALEAFPAFCEFSITDVVTNQQLPNLVVCVSCNGHEVAEWNLSRGTHNQEHKAFVRASLIQGRNGLRFSFMVHQAPGSARANPRLVGFRLTTVKLNSMDVPEYTPGDGTDFTPEPELPVGFEAGGKVVGDRIVGPGRDTHKRSIDLPAEVLTNGSDLVTVLEVPTSRAPASIGSSTDSLPIGILLARIGAGEMDIPSLEDRSGAQLLLPFDHGFADLTRSGKWSPNKDRPLSGLRLITTMPPKSWFGGVDHDFAVEMAGELQDLGAKVFELDTSGIIAGNRHHIDQAILALKSFRADVAVSVPNSGYALLCATLQQENIFKDILRIPTLLLWDHGLLQLPKVILDMLPSSAAGETGGVLRHMRDTLDHPLFVHYSPDSGHIKVLDELGIIDSSKVRFFLQPAYPNFMRQGHSGRPGNLSDPRVAFAGNVYLQASRGLSFRDQPVLAGIEERMLAAKKNHPTSNLWDLVMAEIDVLDGSTRKALQLEPDAKFFWRFLHDEIELVGNTDVRLSILTQMKGDLDFYGNFMEPDSTSTLREQYRIQFRKSLDYFTELPSLFMNGDVIVDVINQGYNSGISPKVTGCMACGGLILFDYKEDFQHAMGDIAGQVMYQNVDHLNALVEEYLRDGRKRREVSRELQHRVRTEFGFGSLCKRILVDEPQWSGKRA